jgi:hypothetical protein
MNPPTKGSEPVGAAVMQAQTTAPLGSGRGYGASHSREEA